MARLGVYELKRRIIQFYPKGSGPDLGSDELLVRHIRHTLPNIVDKGYEAVCRYLNSFGGVQIKV